MARILIVEDEPFERLELKEEIAALYGDEEVRVAESVDDAIAVIEAWKPALLLLDIRLKGQSGLEVARYVRKKQMRSEIIIVTAYNEFEYAAKRALGINHTLSNRSGPKSFWKKSVKLWRNITHSAPPSTAVAAPRSSREEAKTA